MSSRTCHHCLADNISMVSQQGFTLLEAMVALIIFSIGLLGLAGMQISGVQNTQKAMVRTIAIQQAYDMAERLRANRAGVAAGDYNNLNIDSVTCASTNTCSNTDIPKHDFQEWNNSNEQMLPSGQGIVSGNNRELTITVRWDEDRQGITGTNCPPQSHADLSCYALTVIP